MINLPASLEINNLEEFMRKINESTTTNILGISISTKNIAFGGYAAAVQAVNTWAFNQPTRQLAFNQSNLAKAEQFKKAIEHPHKFAAVMMAKTTTLDGDDSQTVKKELNALAKKTIEAQPSALYGQNRGRLCWYSFVDHSTKGFDRNFYSLSPEHHPAPRNIDHITNVIKSMVEQSAKVAGGGELPDEHYIASLGRMFYELFVNTHEHGSRDVNRANWLKPATRLIYTFGVNLSDDAIAKAVDNNKNLTNYVATLSNTDKSTRRFVEISIVDSGLGYCGRWLADHPNENQNRTLDIDSEYQVVKTCFQFRSTSTNNEIKGNGLPAVMANLTALNGFMKIRSDRLSIFRDFVRSPYTPNQDDEYDFLDWDSGESCSSKLTEKSRARGVAITILIPLHDKNNAKEQGK